MKVLLMDTTQYAPASPLFFGAACGTQGMSLYFVDEAPCAAPLDQSVFHRVMAKLRGGMPLGAGALNLDLLDASHEFKPDVVLIVKGAYVLPEIIETLKRNGAYTINFLNDDPFNPKVSTKNLLRALPHYDLIANPWQAATDDLKRIGCKRVERVMFAYQQNQHSPVTDGGPGVEDVVFVGNADSDRVPFFEKLVETSCGCMWYSLGLYGGYWEKHPELKYYARGYVRGRDYNRVLTNARFCVCFPRRANRGDHAPRTFEIPACGGFLLAERTWAHEALFNEGREAEFFTTPDELLEKVKYYLPRAATRQHVKSAGHEKVIHGHHTYADRLTQILAMVP